MGATVLPLDFVGRAMGRSISALLTPTTVVMGKLSADMRRAAAGDVVTLDRLVRCTDAVHGRRRGR